MDKFDYYKKKIGFFLGPLLAILIIIFCDLTPENPLSTKVAAVAIWMAIWWISEVVDLAVTALLPIILLPILQVMQADSVAKLYFNSVIFLFLGGFIIALAMQKWGLHKRIAIFIISCCGIKPESLLLGFMLASAILSMWMSNTATCMMITPIALALILKFENNENNAVTKKFSTALLLGVAYASSIGGLSTLIGTPPNLVLVHVYKLSSAFAKEISFLEWTIMAIPVSIIMFITTWILLCKLLIGNNSKFNCCKRTILEEKKALGVMSFEEKIVLIIFLSTAILWLTRSDISLGIIEFKGWTTYFNNTLMIDKIIHYVNDGTVAIFMAFLLFLIPTKSNTATKIMNWKDTKDLPWGILLLFGGGFALAEAFTESGLSYWISTQLEYLQFLPIILIILFICLTVTFLTELTSNTATTQILLPILIPIAVSIHINPLLLIVPATISASCAFMMPVATPPNTIIFGTNRVSMLDMNKIGLILNIIGVITITFVIYFIFKYVYGYC